MSLVIPLVARKLIDPPEWFGERIHYETLMGSIAYGVSSDTSDVDVYGFCIPPKEVLFPHVAGQISGFGKQVQPFDQYQKHGIQIPDHDKIYDINIFNIVKYFRLCYECNPNMIDSLYTPDSVVVRQTKIAENIRAKRDKFLSKLAFEKFGGYATSQLTKVKNRKPVGSRSVLVEKFGYDVKYAYHLIRLLDEGKQILDSGTIDLQKDVERLKAIRNGEWKLEDVLECAEEDMAQLEQLKDSSKLPEAPDMAFLKQLLLDSLEEEYGSLKDCVVLPDKL